MTPEERRAKSDARWAEYRQARAHEARVREVRQVAMQILARENAERFEALVAEGMALLGQWEVTS